MWGLSISLCSFWSLHIQLDLLPFVIFCVMVEYVPLVPTAYHLRLQYVVLCHISYCIIWPTQGFMQQTWSWPTTQDHLGPGHGKWDQWNFFEINEAYFWLGWSAQLEAPYLGYAGEEWILDKIRESMRMGGADAYFQAQGSGYNVQCYSKLYPYFWCFLL